MFCNRQWWSFLAPCGEQYDETGNYGPQEGDHAVKPVMGWGLRRSALMLDDVSEGSVVAAPGHSGSGGYERRKAVYVGGLLEGLCLS